MRKKIVAGNWKMNKNLQEGIELAAGLKKALEGQKPNCDVIIGTPFIHLASVAEVVKGSVIKVSAENCADKESGAYTGEVSAAMVQSTGAQYVILGHSERRGYYNETSAILNDKVALALKNGLTPIYCCGEALEVREAGTQKEFVINQLKETVFQLSAEDFKKIIIAYEPIWAIGTGKTCDSIEANRVISMIRNFVKQVSTEAAGEAIRILYGGSIKPETIKEQMAQSDIDGALVGGASLKADSFVQIVEGAM
ncbi:MAG: triose-phosphate isomerase [Paludibacteraceae bacterium]|nr:triose-phosphate isomerase [Paludibacteraceae bacterium]